METNEINTALTLEEVKAHLSGRNPNDVEPLYVEFDPPIPIDRAPRWRNAYNLSKLIDSDPEGCGKTWFAYYRPKTCEIGHIECGVCGTKFAARKENRYTARECKGALALFAEIKIYDAYDCPACGCEIITQERMIKIDDAEEPEDE